MARSRTRPRNPEALKRQGKLCRTETAVRDRMERVLLVHALAETVLPIPPATASISPEQVKALLCNPLLGPRLELEHPQGRKSAHGSYVLDLVVVVDNSKPRIVVEERCRNLSAKLCSTLQHRDENGCQAQMRERFS